MLWAYGSAKKTLIASRWPNGSSWAIYSPGSPITVLRSSVGTCRSFLVKLLGALVALVPSILERIPRRVVRSTSVRMADHGDPFDEATIPMARHRAGGHIRRALGPQRHSGALAAEVKPLCPRPTSLACLTQHGQYLAGQRSAWQHIQPCINRFR